MSTNATALRHAPSNGFLPEPELFPQDASDLHLDQAKVAPDSGQASVLLLLMLSTFLLAMMAFAVDLTSVWFHRQSAKAAADAACLAAADDMLALSLGVTPPGTGFTPGSNSDCVSSPAAALCEYAAFNGYNGTGLKSTAASNSVAWTFISSVAGVVTPTGPKAPKYPFLQVNIAENVKTTFMGLMGTKYQQVNATSQCGEAFTLSAPPLLVLDPVGAPAINIGGSGSITILGGAPRSIQVDSTKTNAVSSGNINTTGAGPNLTGGDFAVVGAQNSIPSGINLGTGKWIPSALPYADPFSTVAAPTPVGTSYSAPTSHVSYPTDGCPDNSRGCDEYSPGYYPSGITVKNATAIFLPGIYVLDKDFAMQSNGVVRNAYKGQTAPTLTTDGVMFYMRKGAVTATSDSGGTVYGTVSPTILSCDGTLPKGIPATLLNGSILNAQCTDDGTYSGSGGTGTLTSAGARSLLFFQAHTNTSNPGYDTQGGGAVALSGTEYFHNSTSNSVMHFGGNPSGTTYMLGYIVTDDIAMNGTPSISMVLTQKKLFISLKVGLFE